MNPKARTGAPRVTMVYPEYISDPNIWVCPSDAEPPDPEDLENIAEFGNRDEADCSYAYLGHTFDLLDDTDQQTTMAGVIMALTAMGMDTAGMDPSALGPLQLEQWFMKLVEGAAGAGTDVVAFNNSSDKDFSVAAGAGNGGGETLYRLREGIERFLITDINNPSASAMAQSELYVMFDVLATKAQLFNHVPGGCNVLYMDGHVEFIRYPGEQPICEGPANIIGALFF